MALAFLLAPFLLFSAVLSVDEMYYHRKRGLPKWERVGHPIDALASAFAWAWIALNDYNPNDPTNLYVYIGLVAFACFLSTKDEWIHSELCPPGEQWMHSMMFMLNPTHFFVGGFIWVCAPAALSTPVGPWQESAQMLYLLIPIYAISNFFVAISNFVYWHRRGDA